MYVEFVGLHEGGVVDENALGSDVTARELKPQP
jgi:hypothetical protein